MSRSARPEELADKQARQARRNDAARRACLVCSPCPPDRVPADRLWAFVQRTGLRPFR